jgi:hypothetical protein
VSSTESPAPFARLDADTRARLEAGCAFINHKIAQLRRRVLLVAAITLVLATITWQLVPAGAMFPFAAAFAVIIFTTAHAHRELARWYKKLVINRVVEALGQGLTYSAASSFTRDQFKALNLFRSRIDQWKSEDQITGARNNVSFALHEVRAARREQQGKHTRTVVFFRGLVAVLEFNKHFHGHTVVVPDGEAKILGGLLGEADSRGGKDVVHVADADFERAFAVYATDGQEAHYLLTPKLIQLVLETRRRFGDIRLAFYQNSLYVTIPSSRDRFETSLFSRVTPAAALSELAEVAALAEQLISVLDLDLRIWTRQ